jgi:hypothetical protein
LHVGSRLWVIPKVVAVLRFVVVERRGCLAGAKLCGLADAKISATLERLVKQSGALIGHHYHRRMFDATVRRVGVF